MANPKFWQRIEKTGATLRTITDESWKFWRWLALAGAAGAVYDQTGHGAVLVFAIAAFIYAVLHMLSWGLDWGFRGITPKGRSAGALGSTLVVMVVFLPAAFFSVYICTQLLLASLPFFHG